MISKAIRTGILGHPAALTRARSWRARVLRGPIDQPVWVRPSLLALLIGTAVLYIWGLGASGPANDYYSAAVLAGTKSWKAFFFGSFDASNFITVDKPPASLWVMEISSRIFGFSSWSMLVPQALEGVGAVALLFATVRRWSGPGAGFLAASALALTPVAALMFRFNNPDALLVLLLVAGAYAIVRAIESGSTRWMILCGTFIGFGFLAKMLQAVLVLPVFALVYFLAAPGSWRRRIVQLLAGALATVVSAGWWVAAVTLTPAADRPFIGGSTDNSVLQLIFGYNGFGRLTGTSTNGGGGANFSGTPGLLRLFNTEMGTQIAWLIAAALIGLASGLWFTRRAPRGDRTRAALLLWGGWFLLTGAVFSLMGGIIHPYYTVALGPGVAGVVAVAARLLWAARSTLLARLALAAMVAASGVTSVLLLNRAPGWFPALQVIVVLATVVAVAALLTPPHRWRHVAVAGAIAGCIAAIAGPGAYAIETATTPHTNALPSAGPASTAIGTGAGGPPAGTAGAGGPGRGGTQPPTGGAYPGSFTPPFSLGNAAAGGGGTTQTSAALDTLLKATTTRWAAATIGAQSAASIELSSGTAVMAIGGFTGDDATPTLAQFEKDVSSGLVRYFIAGGMGRGGTTSNGQQITTWVTAHFKTVTVAGQTVYDLTQPTSTSG